MESRPAQASKARKAWRERQGAATIFLDECDIKVEDARLDRPHISVKRLNTESSASRTLVSEMMIMAGQIAAEYGKSQTHILLHIAHKRQTIPYTSMSFLLPK